MTTTRAPAQRIFQVSLAAGLVIIALTAMTSVQKTPPACGDLHEGYAPIIAFELARSAADLHAIFGASASACRNLMTARMDALNWIDVLLFIPVYGVFMAAYFLAIRMRHTPAARAGLRLGLIAVIGDYAENLCLMLLTPALDAQSLWFAALPWATGLKWLALGAAAGCAALIYARGSPRNIFAAAICALGMLATMAAIAAPATLGRWVSTGVAASWCVFLSTAAFGAFRRDAAFTQSHAPPLHE